MFGGFSYNKPCRYQGEPTVPEEEPRYDLAGNLLPPAKSAAPPAPGFSPSPSVAPPLRSTGGPAYGGGPAGGGGGMAGTPGFAPPEPNNNARNIGLGLGGLLLVLIIAAVVLLTPKHTPAPAAYTRYASSDHSFSCLAPSGWTVDAPAAGAKMSDGSESTVGGVLFHQNSASIDITTDTYASLTAYDLMNNNADPQSLTGSKAGALHKQWHKRVAAEHKGYTETQIADFDSPTGDGRLAEWTAAGNPLGFYGPQHGYRASLTGGSKTMVVVCSCLEADWPALKPAFQKVLGSLSAGEEAAPEPAAVPGSP